MTPTLPQDIAAGLPFAAALIAHWLMSDGLAPWKNAIIAAFFIVGTALACIWLSGTFIPGDPQASVLLVVAYVVMLMRGPLSVLAAFFADVPSPFDGPAPPTSTRSVVSRAYIPAGSSTPTVVPPRASQPPSTGA